MKRLGFACSLWFYRGAGCLLEMRSKDAHPESYLFTQLHLHILLPACTLTKIGGACEHGGTTCNCQTVCQMVLHCCNILQALPLTHIHLLQHVLGLGQGREGDWVLAPCWHSHIFTVGETCVGQVCCSSKWSRLLLILEYNTRFQGHYFIGSSTQCIMVA